MTDAWTKWWRCVESDRLEGEGRGELCTADAEMLVNAVVQAGEEKGLSHVSTSWMDELAASSSCEVE